MNDFEAAKHFLLQIAETEGGIDHIAALVEIGVDDESQQTRVLQLLHRDGLISAQDVSTQAGYGLLDVRITVNGLRDVGLWSSPPDPALTTEIQHAGIVAIGNRDSSFHDNVTIVGDGSQVAHGSGNTQSRSTGDTEALQKLIEELRRVGVASLGTPEQVELAAEDLQVLEAHLIEPQPLGIVKRSLRGLHEVAVSASGSTVAQLALEALAQL